MATAYIGQIHEFNPDIMKWDIYMERAETFFEANGIDEDNKKRAILLTSVGDRTYTPDSTRRRARILARYRTPLRLLPDSVQLRHEYAVDADGTRHHAVILAVRRTPLRLSSVSGQLWRSHGCIMYWYMDKYAQYGTTLFSLFKISCI